MRSSTILTCLPVFICQAANLYREERGLQIQGSQHVLGNDEDTDSWHTKPSFSSQYESQQKIGYVAFGDSYSAGIETGVDEKENECRQGVHAYPTLIHADLEAKYGPNTTSFQWLSCTGAVTTDLLSGSYPSQIDDFNTSSPNKPGTKTDFATLSIGGNDLGFFDVINACIFRFYSFYSDTCEAALLAADLQILSPEFEHRLQIILLEILDKVQWEKRPRFTITVTGYARFFNADTPECDDYSFGVWWSGPKLKSEIRHKLNDLVLSANAKLERTVAMVNSRFVRPKVLFVDYDKEFEGHRFCEPGVVEPAYNLTETWFFLIGGPDNAHNETQWPKPNTTTTAVPGMKLHQKETLAPFSALVDPLTCLPHAQSSGDWGELALCYMAMAKYNDPSLQPVYGEVAAKKSMWYVPTYYGKTFHPRTLGHEVIRDRIYDVWKENGL